MIKWKELKGDWKCKLKFQFCRIQLSFPPWPKWIGMSVFVHDRITKVNPIYSTWWFLPFTPKIVEVKYHYSIIPEKKIYRIVSKKNYDAIFDKLMMYDKLISFSVKRDSLNPGGFNDQVKDLDGKTISFTECKVNDQKLESFDGEVYPHKIVIK